MFDTRFYILESTFNISSCVDYIYNNYFSGIIEKINNFKYQIPLSVSKGAEVVLDEFSSKELPGETIQKANSMNPITIKIGFADNAEYRPLKKELLLVINSKVASLLRDNGYDLDRVLRQLSFEQALTFKREFSSDNIRSMISHELSHWLSDTFKGNFIKNRQLINKTLRKNGEDDLADKVMWGETGTPFFSDIEIEGQVHAIKELKNIHKDIWDEMSFIKLLSLKPVLFKSASKFVKTDKIDSLKYWLGTLISKLHEEGLLGEDMKNVSLEEIVRYFRNL